MRHPPPPLPKLMAPGYSAGSKLKFCEGDKDIRWIINTFKKYVRSFVSFNALLMAFMLAISLPCRCSFSKPQGQNTRIQNAFQKMTWQSGGFLWDFSLFNIGYQSIVYLHVPSVSQINGNYVVYKKKRCVITALLTFLGLLDMYFVNHAYYSTLLKGPTVQLVFGFEVSTICCVVAIESFCT